MAVVLYQFYTLIIITTGKPHSHPMHPDYVPSVFPSLYKKSPASGPKLKDTAETGDTADRKTRLQRRNREAGCGENAATPNSRRTPSLKVQLDEAEKEFQCVDREPELSNNSKGQGEREGESDYFAVEKSCSEQRF